MPPPTSLQNRRSRRRQQRAALLLVLLLAPHFKKLLTPLFSDFFYLLLRRINHQSFEASFSYMLPSNQNFFMVVIISVQTKVKEFNYLFDGFFSEDLYRYKGSGKLISTGCQFLGSCNHYLRLVPSYLHRIYCNSAS